MNRRMIPFISSDKASIHSNNLVLIFVLVLMAAGSLDAEADWLEFRGPLRRPCSAPDDNRLPGLPCTGARRTTSNGNGDSAPRLVHAGRDGRRGWLTTATAAATFCHLSRRRNRQSSVQRKVFHTDNPSRSAMAPDELLRHPLRHSSNWACLCPLRQCRHGVPDTGTARFSENDRLPRRHIAARFVPDLV